MAPYPSAPPRPPEARPAEARAAAVRATPSRVPFAYAWLGLEVVMIATATRRPPRRRSATWWSTAPLPDPQPPLK